MSNDTKSSRDRVRRRPIKHADLVEARMVVLKQLNQEEDVAFDARTAKLRALRLAKEEADRDATTVPRPPRDG